MMVNQNTATHSRKHYISPATKSEAYVVINRGGHNAVVIYAEEVLLMEVDSDRRIHLMCSRHRHWETFGDTIFIHEPEAQLVCSRINEYKGRNHKMKSPKRSAHFRSMATFQGVKDEPWYAFAALLDSNKDPGFEESIMAHLSYVMAATQDPTKESIVSYPTDGSGDTQPMSTGIFRGITDYFQAYNHLFCKIYPWTGYERDDINALWVYTQFNKPGKFEVIKDFDDLSYRHQMYLRINGELKDHYETFQERTDRAMVIERHMYEFCAEIRSGIASVSLFFNWLNWYCQAFCSSQQRPEIKAFCVQHALGKNEMRLMNMAVYNVYGEPEQQKSLEAFLSYVLGLYRGKALLALQRLAFMHTQREMIP